MEIYTTFDQAYAAFEEALDDARADFPDVPSVDIAHDMLQVVAMDCTPAVAAELRRRVL